MHERGAPPTGWHRSPRPPGAELRGLEHNLTLASLGVRLLRDTFLTPGWAQAPFGCSGADLCDLSTCCCTSQSAFLALNPTL